MVEQHAPLLVPATELADIVALGAGETPQADQHRLFPSFSRRGADTTIGGAFATSRVPLAPGAIPLTGGFPGADILPIPELRSAWDAVLGAPNAGRTALQYHGPFGTDELRAWLGGHLDAPAEQVIVTNGALHSLAYVLEALVDPGDVVIVENPTYPFALRNLQYFGARIEYAPTDADGLDVEALERLLASGVRPKILYTIPDFQNPAGVTLSAQRRTRILELAEQYGFVIVSDNPYRDLRFAGTAVPDFDISSDRVVLAGTFSKILGPGLRIGWAALPTWLVGPAVRVRLNQDQHQSLLTQRAVQHIVEQPGLFDAIVDKSAAAYAERATVLYDALTDEVGDGFDAQRPEGGIFLWARFPGVNLDPVLDHARAAGTDFTLGRSFDASRTGQFTDYARFAYANANPDQLREAARIVAASLRAFS